MNRRDFLWKSGGGLGGIALASMLNPQRAEAKSNDPASARTHAPKAKRVIQLFMAGAASHVDLWDYKETLQRDNGKKWDPGEKVELFQNGLGTTFAPPWSWQRYGDCGKHLSEITAPLGNCVDDMAFVHNLVGSTGVHSQATYLQATGFDVPGFPGVGSWVSYGLGSMNENLPTFVVLPDHRGFASNGPKNWGAGFLPAQHQGTIIQVEDQDPVRNLLPKPGSFITENSDRDAFKLIAQLGQKHRETRPHDSRLDARIRSYELAARMQLAAPEALDVSKESQSTQEMYGIARPRKTWPKNINADEETYYFGHKCLAARRLLERGVRFVQIWSGNDNSFPRRNWDSHEDIHRDHGPLTIGMARATSALIRDLSQRGMLEDTIVMWTTEFGRMPCRQGGKGRDHNPFVFTNWFAGGGIQGGISHGPSDEWGYKPLERDNPTTVYDIHATLLHQLGVDHEELTVRHNGIDRRLTDVHGHVIHDILT